ncbi:unnamed protein product [Peronospora belbahrii]|uniref:Serine hydrolase domain-containing protein n=1 Tax=Peronospora belbahrii TaxID=622444 RepID=A0ABN8D5R1_9STRA|nr:unnamed protein product [Peronospora belbahrii]
MSTSGVLSRCTDRKLRLLCLHGMYQDAVTFMSKIKHLRGINSDTHVEFIFLDGPIITLPPILARQSKQQTTIALTNHKRLHIVTKKTKFRAWWRPLGNHQEGSSSLDEDRNILINLLREKLDEVGDVDGVVGFSQGASLAAWMCSKQACVELQWSPKLAVLMGSYLGSPQFSLDSGVVPDIASLHAFGSNDFVIPATKSQQVVDIFKQQETLKNRVLTSVHTQGHVIPKCDASKSLFESFLTFERMRLLGRSVPHDDVTLSEAQMSFQRLCAL